jgi:hypothetical protein
MRGNPLTRTTSPGGRWAYTLYDGAGGTPFVHALDTSRRTAHCIDLPALRGSNDLWSLRFHLDRTDPDARKQGETRARDRHAHLRDEHPEAARRARRRRHALAADRAVDARLDRSGGPRGRRPPGYAPGSKSSASELMQ